MACSCVLRVCGDSKPSGTSYSTIYSTKLFCSNSFMKHEDRGKSCNVMIRWRKFSVISGKLFWMSNFPSFFSSQIFAARWNGLEWSVNMLQTACHCSPATKLHILHYERSYRRIHWLSCSFNTRSHFRQFYNRHVVDFTILLSQNQ